MITGIMTTKEKFLKGYEQREHEEKLVEISPFLIIQIMPDKSVYCYRNNGIVSCTFSLSRNEIEHLERESR